MVLDISRDAVDWRYPTWTDPREAALGAQGLVLMVAVGGIDVDMAGWRVVRKGTRTSGVLSWGAIVLGAVAVGDGIREGRPELAGLVRYIFARGSMLLSRVGLGLAIGIP